LTSGRNLDLALANARTEQANVSLRRANAREEQRFDLAMEAVGKYHTGFTKDVLLRQDEFQELRNRLLRDARSFYRKLEDLLTGMPWRWPSATAGPSWPGPASRTRSSPP
jgi:hypothetical protein